LKWSATAKNAPGTRTGSIVVETYRDDTPREELVQGAFEDED